MIFVYNCAYSVRIVPWFAEVFFGQLLSLRYQVDENISALKLYIDIFALYRHTFCYLHAKCRIVNCLLELEVPNMQVLKFCLPKESISEQLDSGYIDTRQKRKVTKFLVTIIWHLTALVYIVNYEIQYYLTVRLISVDKI